VVEKNKYYRMEQLSHLGLRSELLIPSLLQELHHEVSSISNSFCWQDEFGIISNIYDESLHTSTVQKILISISSRKSDSYHCVNEWLNKQDKPVSSLDNFNQSSYLTSFYKKFLIPMGYANSCFVPVKHKATNERLGLLILHRHKREPEFSPEERRQLTKIASIIADGFSFNDFRDNHTTDGWIQGLFLIDKDGYTQHACATAEKLLALATWKPSNPVSSEPLDNLAVFPGLHQLIQNLLSASQNTTVNKNNPTLSITNAWGEFKLRGFLIKDKNGNRTPQIGLNIRWQEPFLLKLFHRISNLELTPRQETVALLYAAGDPHNVIADKLGLSLHTIKEHVRNISDKLNIQYRSDLIKLILCDCTADDGPLYT